MNEITVQTSVTTAVINNWDWDDSVKKVQKCLKAVNRRANYCKKEYWLYCWQSLGSIYLEAILYR